MTGGHDPRRVEEDRQCQWRRWCIHLEWASLTPPVACLLPFISCSPVVTTPYRHIASVLCFCPWQKRTSSGEEVNIYLTCVRNNSGFLDFAFVIFILPPWLQAAAGWPGPDTQNTHICLNIKPNVLHQIFLKIGLLDILIRCSTVHFIYNLDCITLYNKLFSND